MHQCRCVAGLRVAGLRLRLRRIAGLRLRHVATAHVALLRKTLELCRLACTNAITISYSYQTRLGGEVSQSNDITMNNEIWNTKKISIRLGKQGKKTGKINKEMHKKGTHLDRHITSRSITTLI